MFIFWAPNSHAQNEPLVGWYSPVYLKANQPEPSGYQSPLIIPFKKVGNLILVEATIDGITGYFILDTGAPYLVLNATYFRDYPHIQEYAALGINNLEVEIFRTRIDSLRIRDLFYKRLDADVADLSHIENSRNTKILGLLGTNLFTDFVLGIDVKAQQISIQSPEHFAAIHVQKGLTQIPFRYVNNTISVSGSINNEAVQFVFDTGAEINVLDNDLADAVYEAFIIQKRSTLNGSVGETIQVYSGIILRAEISGLPFLNMKTIMTNLDGIGKIYNIQVDGILGFEFLAKTLVYINFETNNIYLAKRKFYD
jgi:hypothetical protein